MVSSVDLTQSPPLLTIDGQTYTVNQITEHRELELTRTAIGLKIPWILAFTHSASGCVGAGSPLAAIFKENLIEAVA